MGALTETSSKITEFSGVYKIAILEVDGETGSNNTITIDEFSTIENVVASLKENPTADCCGVTAKVNDSVANQIDVTLVEGDGTPCTQNALDFYVQAVGY